MNIKQRVISGEKIDITGKKVVISGEEINTRDEVVFLGPDLILSQCHICLTISSKALMIVSTRFEQCTIQAKRRLVNVQWCNAWIEKSTFRGMLAGCDFGTWPEGYCDLSGGIRDCNFEEAVLDGCRFFGNQVETLNWPAWPCFVIPSPKQTAVRLAKLDWPAKLGSWIGGLKEWAPDELKALVVWAPNIIRRFGGTEAELQKLLASAVLVKPK